VTAGTAIARLSHHNSVCLPVSPSIPLSHEWMRQKKMQARITKKLHHRLPRKL